MANAIAEKCGLPVISKDAIKELLFDHVGFRSREEKVNLGVASMEIMYYAAEQLMKAGRPFILENNFEYSSERGIQAILTKYQYSPLTVALTGDYQVIYRRFLERNASPDRHRGHVVNDCYPEKKKAHSLEELKTDSISYEDYVRGIEFRGFDAFSIGGTRITVDTTDFSEIDMDGLLLRISTWVEKTLHS